MDFSGVEEFLDTPVKRYSSGMKVRLAFSVAAHLRPEILIVDEVLAVGDAEFQEKCLGKMRDVAAGGRTVLFVSHNLKAVKQLCTRAVVLSGGRVLWTGPVEDAFPPPEPEPEPIAEDADVEDVEPEPEPVRVPPYDIPRAERLVYEEPVFGGGEAAVDPVGPAPRPRHPPGPAGRPRPAGGGAPVGRARPVPGGISCLPGRREPGRAGPADGPGKPFRAGPLPAGRPPPARPRRPPRPSRRPGRTPAR